LVGAYRADEGDDEIELVSMWTAAEVRRRGVGAALVAALLAWARESGGRQVALWVSRGNDPAMRLYESQGFVATGEYQPLPSDPCRDELRMIHSTGM
jgi:GNAT superfamily N-acetyltransferase